MKSFTFSTFACAASARIDYSAFETLCIKWGYTFKPYIVKTADAWNLTIFQITGYTNGGWEQAERDKLAYGKFPVLAINGSFSDAETWFTSANGGTKPMHL